MGRQKQNRIKPTDPAVRMLNHRPTHPPSNIFFYWHLFLLRFWAYGWGLWWVCGGVCGGVFGGEGAADKEDREGRCTLTKKILRRILRRPS
jgi:hypothetical protein